MPSIRVSYHTEVKCLARENLLSIEICSLIPRSNLWRWKNESPEKYKSFDLSLRATQDYELIRSFSQNKKAKRVFSAYVRLGKFFISLTHCIPKFRRHVHEMRMQVVKIVDRVKSSIGLTTVLRVFNISVPTYRQWSLETFTSRFYSVLNKCNRIYPTQLSSLEIAKLKCKLLNPLHHYWPISSIAYESLRNGSLPLSLNTWYKYSKRLGIVRQKADNRRKKKTEGIRADRPNQIWHADITRFITADHQVNYIYLVVDNFSRKIVSCFVADKVSALIRRETITEALKEIKGEDQYIALITDGGPENSFKEYLDSTATTVTHHKALIDIQCSNSLIEAHNKVIKYNYLYKMSVADSDHLKRLMLWIIRDFNNRPHISLNGSTPNEYHDCISMDTESLKAKKKIASQERKQFNLRNRCTGCDL